MGEIKSNIKFKIYKAEEIILDKIITSINNENYDITEIEKLSNVISYLCLLETTKKDC